jgi:uncharacterized protein (DUF1499 family)
MSSTNPRLDEIRIGASAVCAWLALFVGLVSAASALLAGPGYRAELLTLSEGFTLMRWAVYGAIGGAFLALLGIGLPPVARRARARMIAVLALLICIGVAVPPLRLYQSAQGLPKIHDISTDTSDPPAFVAVLPRRQGARNPVDYRPETALLQQRGYPDIAPQRLQVSPGEAFARAELAARAMGWLVVDVAPGALRIEATDTTLLFGFKDDIVIRVRPQDQGSIVDVRSVSRIGVSDMGTNAKRIRAFLKKLAAV